jgi:nucleotide-binding universal stress UspA family protein
MTMTREPDIAVPDVDAPAYGDGPGYRRILVPVRLTEDALGPLAVVARVCRPANCTVRLVHVQIYDPPMRGCGRFYPQNRTEAAAIPDDALPIAWAYGLRATTAVVEAPRRDIASAIARQAAAWRADMIVMTRRPGPAICRLVLASVPDQVMRMAHCPLLAVHPTRKARFSTY